MANIIGGGPRKPPRIISRRNVVVKQEKGTQYVNNRDDVDEKVRNQRFVHKEVLTINSKQQPTFKPRKLRGVANEVESYPCSLCDRIFLTGSGLEKHAQSEHLERLSDIRSEISVISAEWKKREFESMRSREKQCADKLRHEAKTNELIRAALSGTSQAHSSDGGNEKYEPCGICNVLINVAYPTAMQSHRRAHRKNDELRVHLIEQLGAETVSRLVCEPCALVFTDQQKLQLHVQSHHVRRKRYICKFCGHISMSIAELNLHKTDVHNIHLSSRMSYQPDEYTVVPDYMRSRKQYLRYDDRRARKRAANEINEGGQGVVEDEEEPVVLGQVTDGDTPCRVRCPDCGLKLDRPLLLAKHMWRVHSKSEFNCVMESGGLPSFGVEVHQDGVHWVCCGARFDNRASFIEHRRMHIPTITELRKHINDAVENPEEEGEAAPNYEGELVQAPDGSMQVILPEGMQINGDVYVMFDPDYEGDKAGSKVRIVQTNPREMQDTMGDETPMISQEEEVITMTQEQFDELQMQMGEGWDHMEVMLVNDELEDGAQLEHQEVVEEIVIDHNGEMKDDSDGRCVEINGTPLFD